MKLSEIFCIALICVCSCSAQNNYEDMSDMLSQCNAYQREIKNTNRIVHLCEKPDPDNDYRYYIANLTARHSGKNFLCFLFFKTPMFRLKFNFKFSHSKYNVEAFGVKFVRPESTSWKSEIKYKAAVFIVVPKDNNPLPEIYSMELNGKDVCPFCGNRNIAVALAAGGNVTTRRNWPWHVALYHVQGGQIEYKCGGTIINDRTILTAAHCLVSNSHPLPESELRIKLVDTYLTESGENFNVRKSIIHENFDNLLMKNDIAILILSTKINLQSNSRAACLPKKKGTRNFSFSKGIAIGYGSTDETDMSTHSNVLRQVEMPLISNTKCLENDKAMSSFFMEQHLYKGNYCAGELSLQKGVCSGDSGGGFFVVYENLYFLKGIVSLTKLGDGDINVSCNKNSYALFTEVHEFLDWINAKIEFE